MSQHDSATSSSADDAPERRPAWTFPVEEFSPSFKTPDVQLKPLNEIDSQPIVWEGDARLPRGAVTIIAGEHGSGKSLMAVDWAARISRGERWSAHGAATQARIVAGEPEASASVSYFNTPRSNTTGEPEASASVPSGATLRSDQTEAHASGSPASGAAPRSKETEARASGSPKEVSGSPAAATKSKEIGQSIIAHAGDVPQNLLRLRLDAAAADAPQIASLWLAPPEKGQRFNFDAINRRIYSLACATGGVPDLRLLVIDNLEAWAGNTQEPPCWALMAFLLTRLSELAAAYGITIVVLANLPRSGGAAAARRLDQLLTQAPVVYLAASDPDRHERKLLLPVKNTLAPPAPARACEIVAGRVVWSDAAASATADEFLTARSRRLEARHERESAARWLLAALAGGPLASRELFQQARDCGISTRTLRRAAQSLGLSPRKTSYDGPWQWSLGEAALIDSEPEVSSHGEPEASASVPSSDTLRSNTAGEPEASASVSSGDTAPSDQTEAHASGSPARDETPTPDSRQDAWQVATWNPELATAGEDCQPRAPKLAPAAAAPGRNGRHAASRA